MISPYQAATLAHAIYDPIQPGIFDQIVCVNGITAAIADIDGVRTVTFAGSENTLDWLRDFEALPYAHPQLGILHAGFWHGMGDAWVALRKYLTAPLAIHGHSLGCAHAAILAGLCAINRIPVAQLILFAPPRVSHRTLPSLVQSHVGQIRAYRNGIDPVTEVPVAIPIIAPWEPIAPLIALHEAPEDAGNVLAWHNSALYVQGVKKLC